MPTFQPQLEAAFASRKLIGITLRPNSDYYGAGVLMDLTESHYALRRLDILGQSDGFEIGRTDAVQRVTLSGDYLDYLEWASAQSIGHLTFDLPYEICEIRSVLERAKVRQRSVTLDDAYEEITTGFVISLDDETVVIESVESDAIARAHEVFALETVQRIVVDSAENRQRERFREFLARRP
jgi:hypothetical protein